MTSPARTLLAAALLTLAVAGSSGASESPSAESATDPSLAACQAELAELRQAAANALLLQQQNEELVKQNRMLQSEVDVLRAARDQLVRDESRKWFLYGAIAVALGALLAALLPRLRPRRRFGDWG
ncbi:MAG: hypothetical protein KatS3mg124_1110 [Porticoccaceae bacterium]|nr:MAG: hypothetical protein KatS3mg124_1110 [Porticoccaceae bacterium]